MVIFDGTSFGFRPARAVVAAALALLTVSGCEGTLPTSQTSTRSQWQGFDDVKAAYDKVAPGVTTADELRAAGFDPFGGPNVRVLSYLDIMRQFLTTNAIKASDLDPSVQRCIAAREACIGYYVALEHIDRERRGSTLADLFNFHRQTYETGWNFSALFILHDGKVTYKLWSGIPKIDRRMKQDNPLGPVQEPASIVRDRLP
jgi:hypothetical protein